jgi:hypothetical protein
LISWLFGLSEVKPILKKASQFILKPVRIQ